MTDAPVMDRIQLITGTDPALLLSRLQDDADAIHDIETERAAVLSELAAYRGQFWGQSAPYDHERKVLLAVLKQQRRDELAGDRVTEGAVDDWAHAHQQYADWLAMKSKERGEMHGLEARLAQLDADLEFARASYKAHEYAIRIALSVIGFARTEAALTT